MSEITETLLKHIAAAKEALQEVAEKEAKEERKAEIEASNAAYRAKKEESRKQRAENIQNVLSNTCILTISVEQMRELATTLVDAGYVSRRDFGGIRRYDYNVKNVSAAHVVVTPRYEEGFVGIQGYDILTDSYTSGMGWEELIKNLKEFAASNKVYGPASGFEFI